MDRVERVSGQLRYLGFYKLVRLLIPAGVALLVLLPLGLWNYTPTRADSFGSITKVASKSTVQAGEVFQYTISITNSTGADVYATITDTVPDGIVPQSLLDSGTMSNGVITWHKTVNNGASAQVRFTAIATKTGTIINNDYSVSSGTYSSSGNPVAITVNPGSASRLTVDASPSSLVVGPSSTSNVVITIADAYGNPVADSTTVSIDFNLGAIDGKSPGTTITATTVNGQVAKIFYAMTQAGTAQISVAASGLSSVVKQISLLPDNPAQVTVSAAPTTISTIGGAQSIITAGVLDQYNNPISSQTVNFTTTLGSLNGGGTTATATTNSSGQASVTLAGTTAGTATITAQSGTLSAASTQVYLSPGPPTQIRFNPASNVPISIEADGQSSVNLELQVLDMHGNQVTQATAVTLTTSLGTLNGGGTSYSQVTTNGSVLFTLTSITTTGTANLHARTSALSTDRSVNFLPGAPAQVGLTITPTAIVADGNSNATLVATAYDRYYNIVKDVPVTVTFSVGRGTLNGSATEVSTSGSVLRTLTSDTTLGSVPITVTITGLVTPALSTINFIAGPPANVALVADTVSTTVGNSVALTATVTDRVGHVIPSLPLTFTTPVGSISPAVANTDANGQTSRTLFSTQSGSAVISVLAYNGSITTTGNKTIIFNPGAPALATLQASPTSLVADGLTTAVITATVTDIFANPVPGITPVFTTTLGTLSGSSVTNAAGVVTRTLRSTTQLGTATVNVVGLTATPVVVAFVVGPPSAAVLSATPSTAFVLGLGNPDLVTLVITVTDRVGHPLTNQSLAATSSFGTLSGSGCASTNSQGQLICSLQSTKSGNPTISVASIAATGDVITFNPGTTATSIEVTPNGTTSSPAYVTAGTLFTFTAVAKDVYKNTIPLALFTWGIRSNPPNGGTGTINPLGGVTGQQVGRMIVSVSSNMGGYAESYLVVNPGTAVKGQLSIVPTSLPIGTFADITLVVLDYYGNSINYTYCPTMQSTFGLLTINCTNATTGIALGSITSITRTGTATLTVSGLSPVTGISNVTFTPGPPVQVQVKAGQTQLHANGTDTTPITVTVQDNYGNPVMSGYTMHSIQTTAGTLSCPTFSTNSSGNIICTLTAGTVEGTASFTVKYTSNQTLINNGSDTVSIIIGIPKSMVIDPTGPLTVTAGITTPFKVYAYDIGNALIPTERLNYSWFTVEQGGTGAFSPLPANTWQTSFTGQTSGNVRVRVVVSDNESPPNYVSPGTSYVYVQAAPPVEGVLAVSPDFVTADGASAVNLTLTAMRDSFGNSARDGDVVAFVINSLPQPQIVTGTVTGNTVSATFNSTTVAGTYTISATNSNNQAITLYGETSVAFTPGPPAQAGIVKSTPAQLVANGVSTGTVVLQIADQFNNPVAAGWPLNFTTSAGTFPASGVTASDGRITGTLHAGLVLASVQITATYGVSQFLVTGNVPLVAGPAVLATVAANTTALAAGGTSARLVFTMQDAWGHPTDGQLITPTISPALGVFTNSTVVQNGQVVQYLSPFTRTGAAVVGSQGLTVTGDTAFTVGPNVAAMAQITATPISLTVGETTTLDIAITDAYGNPVSPTTIMLTSTLQGTFDGAASPITRTTNVTGHIATALKSTNSGYEPLAFSGPAGALSLHPNSNLIEYKPERRIIVTLDITGPITWTAGSPLTITASSRDVYYNVIDPWNPVDYIWSQTAAAVNGPGYGPINSIDSHSRSVEFVPLKTGVNHIRAIYAPFQSEPLTVTVVAAPPTAGLVPVTPASIQADDASTTTIRLTNLTDAYGNSVQDGHTITVTVDTRTVTGVVTGGEASVVITATKNAGKHHIYAASSAGTITLIGFPDVTFVAGPPAKAVITASPKIVPVDTTASLSILVYDQFNNLVVDGTVITTSVEKASVSSNLPTVNGSTSVTVSPYALGDGLISIFGVNGALFLQGDTKLTFIPGSPVFANVTASSTNILGNGSSTSALSVVIKDGLHFPVLGIGTAVITVSRGSVLPTTTLVTDGRFDATFTANRSVGAVTIQVSYNGASMVVDGDSLTLIAGPAVSATLTATPPQIHVDTTEKSSLKFTLYDQWGNPVTGSTVVTTTASIGGVLPVAGTTTGNVITFTLSASTQAGPVSFTVQTPASAGALALTGDAVTILAGGIHHIDVTPTLPVSVTAGNSTTFSAIGYDKYNNLSSLGPFNWRKVYGSGDGILVNGVFTGTLAGTLGIQAYTGTIYSTEKSVTIVPGSLYTAVVAANPLTVPVGSVPSQLNITGRDYYGNLVVDGTEATVATDLGTILGSGATKSGVLTRTLLSSIFSGRAHIFVNSKAALGDTVFFSPRAWMTSIPDTLVADGSSRAEVRIRMLDNNGQPTGQIPATVTSTLGLLSYSACAADADVFVCSLTAPTTVGQAYIYADGLPAQGVITFTAGAPSRAYISASPAAVATNGLSTSTLTITVQDAYSHTVTDYTSPLTVTTSLGTVSGVEPTVNGVTHRTLAGGNVAGTAHLAITGFSAQGDTDIPVVGVVAHVSASPGYLTADGQNSTQLTITLKDGVGQPLTYTTAPLVITASLGTLSGEEATVNGVTHRTLTAGTQPGVAQLGVSNVSTLTGNSQINISAPVIQITASPTAMVANGLNRSRLTLSVQDIYGNVLTGSSLPLTVTTSLGTISGFQATVNGVTQRILTSTISSGIAQILVAGQTATGDTQIQFVGTSFVNGDFENGLTNWIAGNYFSPVTATLVYTDKASVGEFIGDTFIVPRVDSTLTQAGGTGMARLGADTNNNTGHAVGQTWLKQAVYIAPTGVTQLTYWYRLLSYDVSVGSPDWGYQEWDPFKVYLNGTQEWQDKDILTNRVWSWTWQTWRNGPPDPPASPLDSGWRQGVLDLTPFAGQVVTLEFRVANNRQPVDNTWVYLDDVTVVHQDVKTYQVFIPIVMK